MILHMEDAIPDLSCQLGSLQSEARHHEIWKSTRALAERMLKYYKTSVHQPSISWMAKGMHVISCPCTVGPTQGLSQAAKTQAGHELQASSEQLFLQNESR